MTIDCIDVTIALYMAMSEYFSTPDFNSSSPESRLDEVDAAEFLHEARAGLVEIDQQEELNRRLSILGRSVQLDDRKYIQFFPQGNEGETVPADYEQIWFRIPRYHGLHATATDVIVRFPQFDEASSPYDLPAGKDHWNDISIEVKYTEKPGMLYWLNHKGLTPYETADAVKLIFPHPYGESDLFEVTPDPELRSYDLNGKTLLALLRAGVPMRQPIDAEDL